MYHRQCRDFVIEIIGFINMEEVRFNVSIRVHRNNGLAVTKAGHSRRVMYR